MGKNSQSFSFFLFLSLFLSAEYANGAHRKRKKIGEVRGEKKGGKIFE